MYISTIYHRQNLLHRHTLKVAREFILIMQLKASKNEKVVIPQFDKTIMQPTDKSTLLVYAGKTLLNWKD